MTSVKIKIPFHFSCLFCCNKNYKIFVRKGEIGYDKGYNIQYELISYEIPIDYRYFENFKFISNLPSFYLFDTFQ